jgi:anaphase-promoting complex subunit 8
VDSWDVVDDIVDQLPNTFLKDLFLFKFEMDCPRSSTNNALDYLNPLLKAFPSSTHIRAQVPVYHYHLRDYDTAEVLFDELYQDNPEMLEYTDFYSNILYVVEKRDKLSCLAKKVMAIDKFRPETCCVVANYYSSINNHEKAIVYFQRCLLLSPSYTQAYTLLGHEYLELKNTSKAIESYHLSTIYNPKDYRAWYGLGQTYQVLRMPIYAIYYYSKAVERKNGDFRMWSALGSVYEDLERWEEAVYAYKKALATGDDYFSLGKLGKVYKECGKYEQALYYFKLCYGECDLQGVRGMSFIWWCG